MKEIKDHSLYVGFCILRSRKMSSEHLILADSIKKVHQQLCRHVKQTMPIDNVSVGELI